MKSNVHGHTNSLGTRIPYKNYKYIHIFIKLIPKDNEIIEAYNLHHLDQNVSVNVKTNPCMQSPVVS